jgi:hypothetical protein
MSVPACQQFKNARLTSLGDRALLWAWSVSAVCLLSGLSPTLTVAKEQPKSNGKSAVKLYGQIDEMTWLCSAAGIQLSGRSLPATVSKVAIGSAASFSGLKEGDRVFRVAAGDNVLVLQIQRAGKTYQASVATDVSGLRSQFESRKIAFTFGDSPFDKELKTLNQYEVTVLLDRSASMDDAHAGCPGDMTKWMWCKQQIDNLFLSTDRVLDGGFNMVLFNNTFQIRNGVTLWELKQIFDRVKPEGAEKNLAAPLRAVLNDYAKRRNEKTKRSAILVLTDGLQNAGEPLQEVLIEASKNISKPGEVSITFLQVGESITAEELFDDLDHNLVAKGASHHLVNFKPFSEVRNKGVLWELLAAIRESRQKVSRVN